MAVASDGDGLPPFWPAVMPKRPRTFGAQPYSADNAYELYVSAEADRLGMSEKDLVALIELGGPAALEGKATQPIHPAPFGAPVAYRISAVAFRWRVALALDPFAGVGRIHSIADDVGFHSIGIEIEPEWAAASSRTLIGNALALPFANGAFDAVITSPTYGNRMADSFNTGVEYHRFIYKVSLGRDPSINSSATMQWGPEYRTFHEAAWVEAIRVLAKGGLFILNIKDHVRQGNTVNVSAWHVRTLIALGLTLVEIEPVLVRGMTKGANNDARTPVEYLFVFTNGARQR